MDYKKIKEKFPYLFDKTNFKYIRIDNQIKIYYAGQKVFDIKKDKLYIAPSKFTVAGEKTKVHYDTFDKYKEFKKPLLKDEYRDVINFNVNSFKINFCSIKTENKEPKDKVTQNIDSLIEFLLKYSNEGYFNLDECRLENEIEKRKEISIRFLKEFNTLEELLQFNYDLVTKTSEHPPFKKSEVTPSYFVDTFKIKNTDNFINDIKKTVDLYNEKIPGMNEKIVQESLFYDENINILNDKLKKDKYNIELLPIEEEFGFKLEDKKGPRRCDNVYLNVKDNSYVFMEVKYNKSVIKSTESTPGLNSHLSDIYNLLFNDDNIDEKNKKIKGLMQRTINKLNFYEMQIDKENFEKSYVSVKNFIILCAYSREKKSIVESEMEEELKNGGYEIIEKLKNKGIITIIYKVEVEDVNKLLKKIIEEDLREELLIKKIE